MQSPVKTVSPNDRRAVLDRGSVPKFLQIANTIRRRMRTGAYAATGMLPNVDVLGEEFGVARMTVFKALDELQSEGLIRREAGRGVFVNQDAAAVQIPLDGQLDHGRQSRLVAYHDMEGPLPAPFGTALDGGASLYLKRIMTVGSTPYHLGHYYVPKSVADAHGPTVWQNNTVARILADPDIYGPVRIKQTIAIDSADFDVAQDLDLQLNAPVFTVARRFLSAQTGTLLTFAHLIFRADMVHFETTLDLESIEDLDGVRGHLNTST
ncbi:GntR family transcriptional regulator [Brucellaceae bacterium VT-16-1752]|nr:GntR family transcriptional regulator [Brucellaceae bacterium VT-16-1752]